MFKLKINKFILCFVFLSGCVSKKQSFKKQAQHNDHDLIETVAGMTHIPDVPFGFRLCKLVHDQNSSENMQIVYHPKKSVQIDKQNVKKVYMTEMETLGWDFINQFENEHELLLMFVRPGNIWCHIRLDENNILTALILSEKKDRL